MKKEILYLIKAQLKYIKHTNFFSILFIHIGTITYAYLRDFNPMNLICFFLFSQYLATILLINTAEKRDYTFSLVTLKRKEIAFTRIILSFTGFIIIYLPALLLQLIAFKNSLEFKDSLHELFMFGGLSLGGIFFYLSILDYFSIIHSKSSLIWFNIIMGFLIGIIAFGAIIGVERSYSYSVDSSTVLVILIYITSFVLAFLSFKTYQERESYLGYK